MAAFDDFFVGPLYRPVLALQRSKNANLQLYPQLRNLLSLLTLIECWEQLNIHGKIEKNAGYNVVDAHLCTEMKEPEGASRRVSRNLAFACLYMIFIHINNHKP